MAPSDRQKWNRKYQHGGHRSAEPSALLVAQTERLPRAGRALDVAGGAGRNAIWLAQRGWSATVVDVSDVALAMARKSARAARISLETMQVDLEAEAFPCGPWDLIVSVHYLQRSLFARFASELADDGMLFAVQPTLSNLERNARPSRRYLLAPGELEALSSEAGLHTLWYQEGWTEEGRHQAALMARK